MPTGRSSDRVSNRDVEGRDNSCLPREIDGHPVASQPVPRWDAIEEMKRLGLLGSEEDR